MLLIPGAVPQDVASCLQGTAAWAASDFGRDELAVVLEDERMAGATLSDQAV